MNIRASCLNVPLFCPAAFARLDLCEDKKVTSISSMRIETETASLILENLVGSHGLLGELQKFRQFCCAAADYAFSPPGNR